MKLPDRVRREAQQLSALSVPIYAGNASFFLLLSIFPLAALLLSLLQHLPQTQDDLFALLSPAVPAVLLPFFHYLMDDVFSGLGSFGASIFNAVAALWASSKGLYSLQKGLNRVYRVRETRSYFAQRALCLLFTVVLIAALIFTLALNGFNTQILTLLESSRLPVLQFLASAMKFLDLYSAILLTLFFAALYLVLPNRRTRVGEVLPGAMGAALAWILFSAIFSYYVNRYNHYSTFYGSISTILLTMLWLYFCLSILFYGAYLNYLLFVRGSGEDA